MSGRPSFSRISRTALISVPAALRRSRTAVAISTAPGESPCTQTDSTLDRNLGAVDRGDLPRAHHGRYPRRRSSPGRAAPRPVHAGRPAGRPAGRRGRRMLRPPCANRRREASSKNAEPAMPSTGRAVSTRLHRLGDRGGLFAVGHDRVVQRAMRFDVGHRKTRMHAQSPVARRSDTPRRRADLRRRRR